MNAPEFCPARPRAEEDGGTVICDFGTERETPQAPGTWGFSCWGCLEIMLRRAADREACEQEWDTS